MLQAFTDDGLLAVNYEVWTYAAGGTTPAFAYQDRQLSVAHTNPIILNARAEAVVFTGVPLKLVFTTPGGDPTSPIWTQDYVGENEGIPPLLATVTPGTTHNNYVATVTPTVSDLEDEQMIILTPDVDSVTTIGTTTFTGTGIQDGVFAGPYVGTTSGSTFTVVIDGISFQGIGLNDVTWGGTPLVGHVYTAKISDSGAVNKFVWRKDAGAWSADVVITGSPQTLTDGVTIKFAATTGHSIDDLWNNVDTWEWRKDGGAWTTGIAITAASQNLIEGVTMSFSIKTGHTLNDTWVVQVETPVRLNFCGLGNHLVYKIIGGVLRALDAGDLKAGFPSTLVWSEGQDAYILNNPSLPVLVEIQPEFIIHEINGDYTVSSVDARHFLNCFNAGTISLPTSATFANMDVWIKSKDASTITVNVAGGTDLIYLPFNPTGVTSVTIPTNGWDCMRFASNGAYWVIIEAITLTHGTVTRITPGTTAWVCPAGITTVYATGCAAGGSGAGAANAAAAVAGGAGAAGQYTFRQALTVVPGTSYNITVPAGTTGGVGENAGAAGANASFGALLTLTGGARGEVDAGLAVAAIPLAIGVHGIGGMFGQGGIGAVVAVTNTATAGGNGSGYGSPGGGAACVNNVAGANGGNGTQGFMSWEW